MYLGQLTIANKIVCCGSRPLLTHRNIFGLANTPLIILKLDYLEIVMTEVKNWYRYS